MARITFTGDPKAPGTDPAQIVMHGVTFPLNESVEVSDEVAAKLRTHSHFTEGEPPAPPKAKAKSKIDKE